MHSSTSLALLAALTTVNAITFPQLPTSLSGIPVPSIFKRALPCPAVWHDISRELTPLFETSGGGFLSLQAGQCNDDARAIIRASFHDCFPDGGCDGSLAIQEELLRSENVKIASAVNKVVAIGQRYGVSNADVLVFAAAHAVATCPLGPRVQVYIGRTDATTPAPTGQVLLADTTSETSLRLFKAKGFTAQDLAALIGAHTTARQFDTDPSRAGAALDSTPGIWDILYYGQTLLGIAPFTFQSDISIARNPETSFWFKTFSVSQIGWNIAFAKAMRKMLLLGSPGTANMADCTAALPF